MTFPLLAIVLSGLMSVGLTPLVKRLAFVVGALDHPGGRRKIHERQVPRLGGLAIFVPVMLSLGLGFWVVPESSQRLEGSQLFGLLISGGCIFLLGVYDDIRGANAPVKFTFQIAAAAWLYFSGVRISEVSTPFGWSVTLGIFALPFTLLWLVGLTNGMNLLDGIDGLATGVAAIASLTILFVSFGEGNTQVLLIAAALLGSLLGFLVFNSHPAQIFLGDCGAMFLGFFLAAISVLANQKSASAVAMGMPIILLGIPIFDTSLVFIRRVLRGKHPFQADRDHLHHRLLALGLSQPKVAITLYVVSGFLGVMALLMTSATRAVAVLILICLVLAVIAAMQRLRAGEFRELWRLIQHGERRRRPPRYRAMVVRNTLPLLERCETVEALRALLEGVRKDLGFETLRVRLDDPHWWNVFGGEGEVAMEETEPFRDPNLVEVSDSPSWLGSAKIFIEPRDVKREGVKRELTTEESRTCGEKSAIRNPQSAIGKWMVVGEVMATKPAWKRRRGSETDDELLQWLADGLGKWIAAKQKPAGQPPPAAARPQEWSIGALE